MSILQKADCVGYARARGTRRRKLQLTACVYVTGDDHLGEGGGRGDDIADEASVCQH